MFFHALQNPHSPRVAHRSPLLARSPSATTTTPDHPTNQRLRIPIKRRRGTHRAHRHPRRVHRRTHTQHTTNAPPATRTPEHHRAMIRRLAPRRAIQRVGMTLAKQINRKLTGMTSLRSYVRKRFNRFRVSHKSVRRIQGVHFLWCVINKVVHAVPKSSFHLVKSKPPMPARQTSIDNISISSYRFLPLQFHTPCRRYPQTHPHAPKLDQFRPSHRTFSDAQMYHPSPPLQTNPSSTSPKTPASFAHQSDQ